jgi:hypothetical protein
MARGITTDRQKFRHLDDCLAAIVDGEFLIQVFQMSLDRLE